MATIPPLQIPQWGAMTPTIDWSPLQEIGKSVERAEKRRALSDLGEGVANGSLDLKTAAGRAIKLGDLSTGVSLLELGRKQTERQQQIDAYKSLDFGAPAQGTGASQPAVPLSLASLGDLAPSITSASQRHGVDPAYLSRTAMLESGGRTDAANPNSSARGPWQFTRATAGQYGLTDPTDPNASADAAARLTLDNRRVLAQNLGREPTPAELYLAHQQGATGATRLLSNPDAPVESVIGPDAARLNGARPGMTAGQFAQMWMQRYDGNGSGATLPTNAQLTQGALPQPGSLTPRAVSLLRQMADPRHSEATRSAIKAALDHELKTSELTPDQKEYLGYWAQGGREDFTTWKRGNKAAGATAITNDMRGENAEAKAFGEAAGKRAGETMAAAGAASKGLMSLSRIEGLLGQVEQGKIQPARMSISAWAKSMGLNDEVAQSLGLDPNGVGSAQALQSLVAESVLGKIGSGGLPANNFSDADREFLVSIFPRIANDPRANKILVETARRVYQQDIAKAKAYQAFKRNPANKGQGFADFEMEWADKTAQQDIFGDLRRQTEEIIGPPRDVNGDQQSAPTRVTTPDQARQLPPGTRFITPDGREFVR